MDEEKRNPDIGYLCLSRREGEGLQIGDVLVIFTKLEGKVIRLGINAPKSIRIERVMNRRKLTDDETQF